MWRACQRSIFCSGFLRNMKPEKLIITVAQALEILCGQRERSTGLLERLNREQLETDFEAR